MAIDLTKMLEKRREALGEGNKFEVLIKGASFWIVAPELASGEWNDYVEGLREDAQEGLMGASAMKDELIDVSLEDQADAFREAVNAEGVDPFIFLQWALEEHSEEVRRNPTRTPSPNTPKRAKRR